MATLRPSSLSLGALVLALMLAGCGGGGGDGSATATNVPSTLPQEPGAPVLTGNTATDGRAWINYRRSQLGLSVLSRNVNIDAAAQNHSDYQRLNNTIAHDEIQGKSGFTGVTLVQRLGAAGYALVLPHVTGEVISANGNSSGFVQAEELITAIYHRFVIFEPMFREIGTGAATTSSAYTYFTADFATSGGFGPGLGATRLVGYPVNNQARVPTNFLSDNESPDPVPNQNEVGYPISVHADIESKLTVTAFTVRPRNTGLALTVRLLSRASDPAMQSDSAAAIVPLTVLSGNTVYDVAFSGTVDQVPVTLNWSFTTK
ncbi:CAP domain-containing protein [Oxalobacteraceae bacterium]|nr:CAP domain-containing protein [Oxalobacteraceae bacterium]